MKTETNKPHSEKKENNLKLEHHYALVGLAAAACYYNALSCGFVFDDMSAIRDNRDLRPNTPLSNLFLNDFWGTPIHKEHSHKSYRPLCVLTFRLNYMLHELNPMGYHLVNVLLHVLVSTLYLRVCHLLLPYLPSLFAALLFAVHPVHTEAVTGVVGRAETLSSLFFLLALLAYGESTKHKNTDWIKFLKCLLMIALATLGKEQGITVTAVCCVYEVFVVQGFQLADLIYLVANVSRLSTISSKFMFHERGMRLCLLVICATLLLVARVKIMGAQLPIFTKFDNPAAVAESPTKQLTLNYLLPVNVWLLLNPSDLCCDWTMGTIPLITTLLDPRNLSTLGLYVTLALLVWVTLTSDEGRVVAMGLALLIFPFLPASNLFFPVGFVVAERVLYAPSMGFCLLVAYGWHHLYLKAENSKTDFKKMFLNTAMILLILIHATKTILRNYDWESEYTLFMAGISVNHRNAKLYNNVGHALESQGKFKDALVYFRKAADVQPDDLGAHMNVGRTYNNLKMYDDAERAFWKAKALLPRPRPGEQYQARIAPSHLNVFLNLANLIAKNKTRLEEADALYRQAISMRSDYIQAYINRGDILLKLNRTQEAQEVYESALKFDSNNPDIYYNLGVICLEQTKTSQALLFFDKALEIDPEHEQALMNSAILIQESGNPSLRSVAYQRLNLLLDKGKANERIYFNLGMLAMDDKDITSAEMYFKEAVKIKADFRSALFNLALLLSDLKRPLEAVPFLKQLLKYHPNHIKGLILLGDIYINYMKDVEAAHECYQKILELDPSNIQAMHNLCVVYVEQGALEKAEDCLLKAYTLAPQEDYIEKHLRIVRARIAKNAKQQPVMTTTTTTPSSEVLSPTTTAATTHASSSNVIESRNWKTTVNKRNISTR